MSFAASVIKFYQATVFYNVVISKQKLQIPYVLYSESLTHWKMEAQSSIENIDRGMQTLSQCLDALNPVDRCTAISLKSQLNFTQVRLRKHIQRIDKQLLEDKSLICSMFPHENTVFSFSEPSSRDLEGLQDYLIHLYEQTTHLNLLIEDQKRCNATHVELSQWIYDFESTKKHVIETLGQIPVFGVEIPASRKVILEILKAQLIFTLSRVDKHLVRIKGSLLDKFVKA